jgi:hypothetical protein
MRLTDIKPNTVYVVASSPDLSAAAMAKEEGSTSWLYVQTGDEVVTEEVPFAGNRRSAVCFEPVPGLHSVRSYDGTNRDELRTDEGEYLVRRGLSILAEVCPVAEWPDVRQALERRILERRLLQDSEHEERMSRLHRLRRLATQGGFSAHQLTGPTDHLLDIIEAGVKAMEATRVTAE